MKEKTKKFNLRKIIKLFFTFFKTGLFSFGGGYTMVVFFEREFVEKLKWLTASEFSDLLAIAESTPGPIAINSATYIGYRIAGFWGSFFSTLATCLPSFIIIYIISLFYEAFLDIKIVQYAFKGIQAGVSVLILIAGLKMFKKLHKDVFNYVMFFSGAVLMLTFAFCAVKFSSIYYIIGGGVTGLIMYFITLLRNKKVAEEKISNGENISKTEITSDGEKEADGEKAESSTETAEKKSGENICEENEKGENEGK